MGKVILKCFIAIASAFVVGLAFFAFIIEYYLKKVESMEIEYN